MKLALADPPEVDDMLEPEALEEVDGVDEPAEPDEVDGMEEPADDPDGMVDPLDPVVDPDVPLPEPVVDPAAVEPALGCIAEEPEVAEPEPVAAGRSVPPEGAVDCAKAGAVASAEAMRQAAICVFSIWFS